MAVHWFFEDELISLRQEWARLMRAYGRSRRPELLDQAHAAHQRYLERVDELRTRPPGPSRRAASARSGDT